MKIFSQINSNTRDTLRKYLTIILGTAMVGFAVSVFYIPNKIVGGGVSGISTILFHTLKIEPGVSFAVINIILLTVAFKSLGKKFVIDSVTGAALLSVFVQIFSYVPSLCDDIFLAMVFGSVLYGMGIGLTFAVNASTGGTDILSRLLQQRFPDIKIGNILLAVDMSVILASLATFGKFELTLYGVTALSVSSFSVNWIIHKLNISKLAFVVTVNGCDISRYLTSQSPRGVTVVNAAGGYTGKNVNVLMCAMKENEVDLFQKRIIEADPKAFVIYTDASQILGNGFKFYK